MSKNEVQAVLNTLRNRVGLEVFNPVANKAYYRLKNIQPRCSFEYLNEFKTDIEKEIFIVVAFRYIGENPEYSFTDNSYTTIKRYN
jgi:hypothetical protein